MPHFKPTDFGTSTMNVPLDGPEGAGSDATLSLDDLNGLLAAADPALASPPEAAAEAARRAVEVAALMGRVHELGRARAWLCAHLLRLARHTEVLAEAARALPLLEAPELTAERRELLRITTLAGCEIGAFDKALDAAHELVRITAPDSADGAALDAALALAMCFERMGDSWQAVRLLTLALADHAADAPPRTRLLATNGLCATCIGIMHRLVDTDADDEVRDILARARTAGEQARELLQVSPDPVYEVAVQGNLGEVMLHQGELAGAEPLLRRSLALAQQRGLAAHGWRIQASLGAWLLASGRPGEALGAVQLLLETAGAELPPLTATRAHHTAYLACRALRLHDRALAHFEQVERMERRRAMTQLRAQSQLFVTRTEVQQAQWHAEQARLEAQHQRERAARFAARAERDPLTGLGNRRHLEARCAELLPAARRAGQSLAVAQIDIDHFKAINDRHGHAVGDAVLVAMAQLLRENTRSGDVLVRQGGEEFVVILPAMALERAAEVCERLRERVAAHDWRAVGLEGGGATISIGLTASPPYEAAALLTRADEALYRAKREGRNRLVLSADAPI